MSNTAKGPEIDFSVFGPIESRPVSRVQQFVAGVMERNWNTIPHVTHNDEADVSSLTEVRKSLSEQSGVKVTPLAFLIKAAVKTLKALPHFNASLDGSGKNLIMKQYFHIGFAVDTPAGLLVPVIHNADQKSIVDIALEVSELSEMARTKGLPMDKMSGGCFTISSLGSIGGTSFSPIINAPEVAIMGITKSYDKPFNSDGNLVWKTMLPMSLSYDHRVINGADAARFCVAFGQAMSDARSLIDSE